jgi:hypothetical protein
MAQDTGPRAKISAIMRGSVETEAVEVIVSFG